MNTKLFLDAFLLQHLIFTSIITLDRNIVWISSFLSGNSLGLASWIWLPQGNSNTLQYSQSLVYSGVVSLQDFIFVIFIAELYDLQLWATDIGNTYLEAYMSEKVCIIDGPEFGDSEGHVLIISKVLYGLRSSGARWHDRFAACIR
jgi:hypothetical protein